MKVYALIESRYDFCNTWETTYALYKYQDTAEWEKLTLEESNQDEQITYHIKVWTLDESKI
jgi:hypothetical protein